jgi:IS5 family transposase
METSQSPRKVIRAAYRLGRKVLPDHTSTFSRHDFTLPQLFACLVLREFYGLSYRRTEQLLRDSPQWLAGIGLSAAPDHNTLWRALGVIVSGRRVNRLLDLLAVAFARAGLLRLSRKPLALDSTCFEQGHRSAHYDRRCRQMQSRDGGVGGTKRPEKPGKWGASVNASRRRRLRAMPKLSVAVAAACHLILAAVVRTGSGSDAPDFDELLYRSWKRAGVKVVVADAGYDAEHNHRIARQDMGVRSVIPPGIGRPTEKLPGGRWRRHMAKRFARKADQKHYAQRSQSETVHSMVKRNQGSALRSRTPERRKQEMLLRVLTHNIMLLAEQESEE